MSASDIAVTSPHRAADDRPGSLRAVFFFLCVAVPLAIWLTPFPVAPAAKGAMAISSFMILAWMTNVMEYGAAGLIGCLLFWATGVAKVETAFSGFANDTPWFLFGAVLLGTAANKTGVPQRIG
jgi:di/tricarboxylate transporter